MKRPLLLLCMCVMVSVSGHIYAETGDASAKSLDGFASTRTEILSLISGSTQNVRIVTDFLSDGEIVSALYIAQYRKVNVQVLLGQGRATHVLSRLSYLKAQNVPVWLRPRGFMGQYPTIIQADQKLFALDAELDYMARHRRFTLTPLADQHLARFVEEFTTAQNTGISPTPKAVPLVGRPGSGYSAYKGPGSKGGRSHNRPGAYVPAAADAQVGGNAAYRYNRIKQHPSPGVATKLPRNTILQNRAEQPPVQLPVDPNLETISAPDTRTVQ